MGDKRPFYQKLWYDPCTTYNGKGEEIKYCLPEIVDMFGNALDDFFKDETVYQKDIMIHLMEIFPLSWEMYMKVCSDVNCEGSDNLAITLFMTDHFYFAQAIDSIKFPADDPWEYFVRMKKEILLNFARYLADKGFVTNEEGLTLEESDLQKEFHGWLLHGVGEKFIKRASEMVVDNFKRLLNKMGIENLTINRFASPSQSVILVTDTAGPNDGIGGSYSGNNVTINPSAFNVVTTGSAFDISIATNNPAILLNIEVDGSQVATEVSNWSYHWDAVECDHTIVIKEVQQAQ